MDELVPPVVTAKPARGREMKTTTIPTDMFDTMRMMTAKKTLGGEEVKTPELEKPTDGTAEYYHEGYIDGKLYLVPDSNLEAMKDIINFKMRPRRSTRYKHQTSYEISDYDHFRGKLDGLFTKLDNIDDLNSNLSDETTSRAPVVSEPEERPQKKSNRRSSEEESDEKYEDQDSEYESANENSESDFEDTENKSEDRKLKEEPQKKSNVKFYDKEESDVHYLRFLVSGHFKKDQKPIYIIQEYNGEPDLFKNQKADFISKQKDGDVDMFISGKFYNENMLEESNGEPVALLTKPIKIKIETEKSKIYYDYFKDIYNIKNFDISFKGEFIKSKVTNRITPFLTLGVQKRTPNQKLPKSANPERKDQITYNKNKSPTTVLVYKPKYDTNPFSYEEEYNNKGDIDESSAKEYLYPTKTNESSIKTDPHLSDNSSQQVATHFYSYTGEEFTGEGIVNKPINEPFHRPNQPSSNQSTILSVQETAEAKPLAGETLNTQNTSNTKKSLKEAFLNKLLKGNSMLKTLFERKTSKDNFEVGRTTQKMKSTQNIKNMQQNPTTEDELLENKIENTPKNKIKSIFHKFKYSKESS